MKKRFLNSFILFFLILTIVIGIYNLSTSVHVIFTSNVQNYNTHEYPLIPLFPKQIPKNATVVEFCYYDFHYEDTDAYLEIKFKTQNELDEYLTGFTEKFEKEMQKRGEHPDNTGEWFYLEQNPYDESYIDMFCTSYSSWKDTKHFSGYEIGDGYVIINQATISFSYKDLTVIHSSSSGAFECENDYTPKYIDRFRAFLSGNHQRYVYFSETYKIGDKTGDGVVS